MWVMASEAMACTSAVVSGKVTPDGRPLLWKHRDTGALQNSVKYFSGEKYSFIAVVNSGEDNPTDVWIGTNSAGFSVMNTQSYNLVEVEDDEERGEANGRVMRRALEICATVDDFKVFLDTLAKPSLIEANFGVIDAQGGAAMFEVDYEKYVMFDANDPKDAPCGYIARSNFSFTGKVNVGAGYVRYMQEDKLLMPASAMKRITPAWIFSELSRSFANPILGIDLRQGDFNLPKGTGWFVEQDFISRHESASSVVIQGVKNGENPDLVTMWTVLGYPPVSVALPLWVKGAERKMPVLVQTEKDVAASGMSRRTTILLDKVYAYNQGMGTNRYFNWELLYNLDKTGYMQLLAPVEMKVFQMTEPLMEEWRTKGTPNVQQMHQLYDELDRYVAGEYNRLFGL
ncbi:MAG: hypothetical protein Q4D36_01170 [Bacteroidales bacterium]|nr:hypothetical protein [Bacteroidales bacterium]